MSNLLWMPHEAKFHGEESSPHSLFVKTIVRLLRGPASLPSCRASFAVRALPFYLHNAHNNRASHQ